MSEFPEHEKMAELRDKIDAVTEFLEWCESTGKHVVTMSRHSLRVDEMFGTRELLAAHFQIDERKIEAEKQAMIAEFRAAQ